jgi:hypothetical protein
MGGGIEEGGKRTEKGDDKRETRGQGGRGEGAAQRARAHGALGWVGGRAMACVGKPGGMGPRGRGGEGIGKSERADGERGRREGGRGDAGGERGEGR